MDKIIGIAIGVPAMAYLMAEHGYLTGLAIVALIISFAFWDASTGDTND